MRFLYADSDPFPLDYDFLATLRGFLDCAAAALGALSEAESLEQQISAEKDKRRHAKDALDQFATSVAATVDLALARSPEPELTLGVAQQVREHLDRAVSMAKDRADATVDQLTSSSAKQAGAHRETIRNAVEAFLLTQRLDIVSSRFRMRLEENGYHMFAVCTLPKGLEVAFRLAATELEQWQAPRRVGDLVGEMQIQVGVKKKFLKRDITRELAHVEDLIISHAELDGDHAEVTLRRKPDAPKESMVLVMSRTDGDIDTQIRRPIEKGDERRNSVFPAAPDDLGKMEHLWDALEAAAKATLPHTQAVSTATLDGDNLFEGSRILELFRRYVELYGPIVAEIARRSPSPRELSLKVEHAEGRREEIYLKREELAGLISSLDDDKMALFAPLDFFPEVELDG